MRGDLDRQEIFNIGSIEREYSLLPVKSEEASIFRLWIIRGNERDDDREIPADLLKGKVCFYPAGYLPDISMDRVFGYTILFNSSFLRSKPSLRRIARLLSDESVELLPIIKDSAEWYDLFYNLCICHEITERKELGMDRLYASLHCTLAASYLYDLLIETIPWITPVPQLSEVVRRFLALVEQHYKNQRGLQFYAAELHVSDSILLKKCQKELGKSPLEVIHQRVIKAAKYLLIHTDLPVGEISDQLAFNSNAYFSERFKQLVKVTPKAFRNLYHTKKE